jgi:hypothetical protein
MSAYSLATYSNTEVIAVDQGAGRVTGGGGRACLAADAARGRAQPSSLAAGSLRMCGRACVQRADPLGYPGRRLSGSNLTYPCTAGGLPQVRGSLSRALRHTW